MCLCCLGAGAGQDLAGLLGKYKIPFDSGRVRTVADEALIRAIDPGASIISFHQASVLMGAGDGIEVAEKWTSSILYVRFFSFNSKTADSLAENIAAWTNSPAIGVILDIRSADGDSLEDIDAIAGMFVPAGTALYSLKNGAGDVVANHVARSVCPLPQLANMPLIFLVNNETACAPEILCCALRERKGVLALGAAKKDARPFVRSFLPYGDDKLIHMACRWAEFPGAATNAMIADVEPASEHGEALPLPPERVIGKKLSEKMKHDRDLIKRTADDPVLAAAADVLLALKALEKTEKNDNTSSNSYLRTAGN